MAHQSNLPKTASVAHLGDQGRMHAPSAERNAAAITTLLQAHAPPRGTALEIASGTGQHVVGFARALPDLIWHPSEVDPQRRTSIDAWAAGGNLPNLRPAMHLDATAPGWAKTHGDHALIVLINLLHLITTPQAQTLIHEAAQALAPAGRFVIYGPFLRQGHATSDGDARFDASLRAQDPAIGYKDIADVKRWLGAGGLCTTVTDMPANNLAFIAGHPCP